ncbi:hypothetical protein LMG33818_000913 [Halomonadaceae bacterium LMG 33818]|uniref:helix-turn-helix domain-containing protein n=1 Tax=Cernens ardua TaxID=3402176 RepID=UPI003EDC8A5F
MSIEAMSWALKQQHTTDPGARAVLIGLANHAYSDGTDAFPSISTLVGYTGLSERTVQNKLKYLREIGLISLGNQDIARAKGLPADKCPRVYNIHLDFEPELDSERGAAPAPGANDDTTGVQLTTERGAAPAPETSFNRPTTVHKKSKGAREKKSTQLPEDFQPNDTAKRKAESSGLNIQEQLEYFKDYHAARGSTFKDWQAAFRTWLNNANRFATPINRYKSKPRSTPGMHTGLSDFSNVKTREDGTVDF